MSAQYPFQQLARKSTRSTAIKAMCAQCVGGPSNERQLAEKAYDSDWKATIKTCPSMSCPLHEYRPYQPRKAGDANKEAS